MAKKKSKKDYSFLIYVVSLLITLVFHYFFISKININSTFQVAIDFAIVLLLSGFVSMITEESKKH